MISKRVFKTFHSKILAFFLLWALLFTFLFSCLTQYTVRSNARNQMRQLVLQAANSHLMKIESHYQSMSDSIEYILSNPEMLQSITAISHWGDARFSQEYIQNSETSLRQEMRVNYLGKNAYRVIYFNENGLALSSYNAASGRMIDVFNHKNHPYFSYVKEAPKKTFYTPPHMDPWGYNSKPIVFSIIKEIRGVNMGYIEVQNTYEQLFSDQDFPKSIKVSIFINEGDLLYSNSKSSDFIHFQDSLKIPSRDIIVSQYGHQIEMSSVMHSDKFPLRIVVSSMQDFSLPEYRQLPPPIFLGVLILILLSSVLLFFLLQKMLTPLSQLHSMIRNTNLETIDKIQLLPAHYSSSEFETIQKSYLHMSQRLNDAIRKEKNADFLRLQAQFDTLQAQVNPHFIYNVLNIISAQALLDDDEIICDTCSSLAEMLRYSTDTQSRYANISQELAALEHYIYLLKARWQDGIYFTIQISEDLGSLSVPKMLFQQILENSIVHGFTSLQGVRKVHICGILEHHPRGDRYVIDFWDNGCGFSLESLLQLQENFILIRERLHSTSCGISDKIGGMGLKNSYARLYLQYASRMHLLLGNNDNGSAHIRILIWQK